MKKGKSILKDKSVILAVGLLAAIIILLGYNQFTGAASPVTGMMGVYSGSSTTDSTATKDCSYCKSNGSNMFCYKYKGTNCTPNCTGDSECQKKHGGSETKDCSYCSSGVCKHYQGTNCNPNCTDDASCNKGSGGSGGGSTTPPKTPAATHKECTAVAYGYTSYCRPVSGAGDDTCTSDASCGGAPGPNEPPAQPAPGYNPPFDKHTECVNGACATVNGNGINQCTFYTDCSAKNQTNIPQTSSQNKSPSTGGFWAHLWSVVMSWFGR